eukprot:CAMPEP_0113627926 /NCGR_PEP_ID=MMETSP0017_2-20120614/14465_1 /TAXON_ID=2856 /ORGANISM="Cylindrotheca closterium" /LENGTH=69 /DNA_ID=CAMNT_0000538203 /DNA_START=435 /DNA_END=645 /DNA_ORIENTATION=+ /assembly_acc=CAM_ASM_000147
MEGEMEKDKKKRLVDAKKEKEALEILEKGKPVGTLKGNELTTCSSGKSVNQEDGKQHRRVEEKVDGDQE